MVRALALLLIAGGCVRADAADHGAASCRMGAPPPGGELTWVAGGRLLAVRPDGRTRRCLAVVGRSSDAVRWSPTGDRALIDASRLLAADGRQRRSGFGAADVVGWSRPEATSLLAVHPDGRLTKRPSSGGPSRDITFLNQHEAAVYHPGGRAIVSVGHLDEYGIFLADNTGKILTTLAQAETARRIESLSWTADGGLVFAAAHDAGWDVHRLDLATGRIDTLASTPSAGDAVTDLVTSPFAAGTVAWRQGDCRRRTMTARVAAPGGAGSRPLPAAVATTEPVGWLPDGTLVVRSDRGGCATRSGQGSPGDVWTLCDGFATRVLSGVAGVGIRVVVPPRPALPSTIPSQAPI